MKSPRFLKTKTVSSFRLAIAILVLAISLAMSSINTANMTANQTDRPDTAEIWKHNSHPDFPADKDKVWFDVHNNDPDSNRDRRITDFHVRVWGATIESISSPPGWTGDFSNEKGKNNGEATWIAKTRDNSIPRDGCKDSNGKPMKSYEDRFDVKIKDKDSSFLKNDGNEHLVEAWVTYDGEAAIVDPTQPTHPAQPAQSVPFSIRYFDQKRADTASSWETKPGGKSKAVIHGCQIGPAGGGLDMDTHGSLLVPPGAVLVDTSFSAYVLPDFYLQYIKPRTTDNGRVVKAFCLDPEGQMFAKPVTITLSYASVPGLTNPRVYYWDPKDNRWWRPVRGARVNAGRQVVVFQIPHLGRFGLGGDSLPSHSMGMH